MGNIDPQRVTSKYRLSLRPHSVNFCLKHMLCDEIFKLNLSAFILFLAG